MLPYSGKDEGLPHRPRSRFAGITAERPGEASPDGSNLLVCGVMTLSAYLVLKFPGSLFLDSVTPLDLESRDREAVPILFLAPEHTCLLTQRDSPYDSRVYSRSLRKRLFR